jgi:hypothetical protein
MWAGAEGIQLAITAIKDKQLIFRQLAPRFGKDHMTAKEWQSHQFQPGLWPGNGVVGRIMPTSDRKVPKSPAVFSGLSRACVAVCNVPAGIHMGVKL